MVVGLAAALAVGVAAANAAVSHAAAPEPACADMGDQGQAVAPQPKKSIDAARFYSGRWYEIARTPMKLTDGCVAGTTDYHTDEHGRLIDRDACRAGSPEGKEKVFAGPVSILNPGQNTKVQVHYRVFKIFTATKTYWMLDHDDDYRWFIVSDPALKTVSLFTRAARPSADEVKQLAARAQALGYDASKLEYPAQFPAGEGQAPAG
jgi:apolipoprotein D and lipocalin family protein